MAVARLNRLLNPKETNASCSVARLADFSRRSIKFIESVITQLDNRVKTMNNDIIKIDQEVSEQLGLPIDTDRVARADGKTDARKD